jgi:protein required for attachment to host cells
MGDVSGDADKGHGRTGHSGTQFEPRSSTQAKERASFARQLADYLNQHSSEHRFESLVLIASSPMLGQVEPLLGHTAKQCLQKSVVADLTSYQKNELRQRVHRAMALPES